jgi:hypothetical protein
MAARRTGSTSRPCITWTKPASASSPAFITFTTGQSYQTAGPASCRSTDARQATCCGRSPLRLAAASLS